MREWVGGSVDQHAMDAMREGEEERAFPPTMSCNLITCSKLCPSISPGGGTTGRGRMECAAGGHHVAVMGSLRPPNDDAQVAAVREAHDMRVAKIVTDHWRHVRDARAADRASALAAKRAAWDGLREAVREARALYRVALVHHARRIYERMVAGAFEAWLARAEGRRAQRAAFAATLARRALLYVGNAFARWCAAIEASKRLALARIVEAWRVETALASAAAAERAQVRDAKAAARTLRAWRVAAALRGALREATDAHRRLRASRVLRGWRLATCRDRIQARTLIAWRNHAHHKATRREALASRYRMWAPRARARRLKGAVAGWRAVVASRRRKAALATLADAMARRCPMRAALGGWRKRTRLTRAASALARHRVDVRIRSCCAAWRALARQATLLATRQRQFAFARRQATLRACLGALAGAASTAAAGLAAADAMAARAATARLASFFMAWRDEGVSRRRSKRAVNARAALHWRRRRTRDAVAAWRDAARRGRAGAAVRRAADANACARALSHWRDRLASRRAADDAKSREAARHATAVLMRRGGSALSFWGAWAKRRRAKHAQRASVDAMRDRRVLMRCVRGGWAPYVRRQRTKHALLAMAEAVRAQRLQALGLAGMRRRVIAQKMERTAASMAQRKRRHGLVERAVRGWAWWAEGRRHRRAEEREASAVHARHVLGLAVAQWTRVGVWRHRTRVAAAAERHAHAQRRRLQRVEPLARRWRFLARQAAKRRHAQGRGGRERERESHGESVVGGGERAPSAAWRALPLPSLPTGEAPLSAVEGRGGWAWPRLGAGGGGGAGVDVAHVMESLMAAWDGEGGVGGKGKEEGLEDVTDFISAKKTARRQPRRDIRV